MESNGSYLPGYNCQAAVDGEWRIIVGRGLANQPPDAVDLGPLLDDIVGNCGDAPVAMSGDTGFWCADVDAHCARYGTVAYISTERRRHWDADDTITDGSAPDDASPRERMRHRARTAEGREIYARRKVIVEPVFGQIKEARGVRRFLLRGIDLIRSEWGLLYLTHNLLRLFRWTRLSPAAQAKDAG